MTKKPIKVIKREDRRRVGKSSRHKKNAPVDPTRKAIQTVSEWVREFKEKGNAEASRVITTMLDKTPRPSEA